MNGWMGEWMWMWPVIGVLITVLLFFAIHNLSKEYLHINTLLLK